jgi:ribokinase
MSKTKLVVIGSANIDLVTRVHRSPKPGESLIGHSFSTVCGGKGANQAVAAARLGAEVTFVGCVGDDAFGAAQRDSLQKAGVDCSRLKIHPEEPTGTAVILVADEGQNSIVVTPSANYGLLPEDVQPLASLVAEADAVLLQLEIPLDTVEAILDMARENDTLSILDAGPAQQVSARIIAKADVVSPNETEATALTEIVVDNIESAQEAAQQLLEMGATHAVMKLGALGALYTGEQELFAPAFPIDAVDSTAAGDAFTAALAVTWKEKSLEEALSFANAAGALSATVSGAQPSMPTRNAVEEFLKTHCAG